MCEMVKKDFETTQSLFAPRRLAAQESFWELMRVWLDRMRSGHVRANQ
jgi:hypothetical protein